MKCLFYSKYHILPLRSFYVSLKGKKRLENRWCIALMRKVRTTEICTITGGGGGLELCNQHRHPQGILTFLSTVFPIPCVPKLPESHSLVCNLPWL